MHEIEANNTKVSLSVGAMLEVSDHSTVLRWDGVVMPSITRHLPIVTSSEGKTFFLKAGYREREQLSFLAAQQLPVPTTILDLVGGEFATVDCGSSVREGLNDSKKSTALMKECARTIVAVHTILSDPNRQPNEGILQNETCHTANITRSFRCRYVTGSVESFKDARQKACQGGRFDLDLLLDTMDVVADEFRQRMNCSDGLQICYGDYKPDNVAYVVRENGEMRLTLLDPTLCRGSQLFDIAKFVSRILLEPEANRDTTAVSSFMHGLDRLKYSEKFAAGFSLRELVLMDTLNVLSSYILANIRGDTHFRLCSEIFKANYRTYLADHLLGMASGRVARGLLE